MFNYKLLVPKTIWHNLRNARGQQEFKKAPVGGYHQWNIDQQMCSSKKETIQREIGDRRAKWGSDGCGRNSKLWEIIIGWENQLMFPALRKSVYHKSDTMTAPQVSARWGMTSSKWRFQSSQWSLCHCCSVSSKHHNCDLHESSKQLVVQHSKRKN